MKIVNLIKISNKKWWQFWIKKQEINDYNINDNVIILKEIPRNNAQITITYQEEK